MNLDEYAFSPKNLDRQNRKARNEVPGIVDGSDFSSYAIANRGNGLSGSGIEDHNLLAPQNRVRICRCAIAGKKIASIADLGCGLGFTSAALAEVFNTNDVTGYEVSEDACEFASQHWPSLKFIAGMVVPNVPLQRKYDLILAQEFYPFTRTDDLDVHLQFAETFAASLTTEGVLLITLTAGTTQSILNTVERIEPLLRRKGFVTSLDRLPFDKVYALLPVYWLANIASSILSVILNKPRYMAIQITRQITTP